MSARPLAALAVRATALAVASLTALSSCSGDAATLGEPISAVGGAPREQPVLVPRVGECRQLDQDALSALNDNHPAVPCTGDHTAVTYHVGTLHGDPREFTATTLDDCRARQEEGLGLTTGEVALTVMAGAFYIPSAREYALGARTYRCDLVAADATARAVPLLPAGSTVPLFAGVDEVPDALRRCRDRRQRDTPCTRPHVWRASGSFRATGGSDRLPAPGFFRSRARNRCPAVVTTDRYQYTWPSINGWQELGQRTVVCWSRDERT